MKKAHFHVEGTQIFFGMAHRAHKGHPGHMYQLNFQNFLNNKFNYWQIKYLLGICNSNHSIR